MIHQARKNIFIINLLNRLNNLGNGSNIVRYVTFKARESNGYFGKYEANGFTQKLEGKIIVKAWKEIPAKFPKCILGEYVIKPNVFNGIITLDKSLTKEKQNKQYLTILTYFKNRSTELINKLHGTHGKLLWENNYDEITISDIDNLKEVITFLKKSA